MPILDFFWSMLMFFLFFAWIWLVITVFMDVFRSPDLSGWGKAGWSLFVLVIPVIGVLVYLVARGDQMQQRRVDDFQAQQSAQADYIRSVAGNGGGASVADELTKLSQLRDDGTISDSEYQQQKSKLLA